MSSLVVRPASALMSVPISQMDPLSIGHKLLVQFVLAGSFFRSEKGFDLNWQLLDVPGESVKAGGSISVPSFDLVAVQNEICTEVFSSLQGTGAGVCADFPMPGRRRARRWQTLRRRIICRRGRCCLRLCSGRARRATWTGRGSWFEKVVETRSQFCASVERPGHYASAICALWLWRPDACDGGAASL